ncbi:MAG: hypothetical protein AB3N14_16160 [Flavobacteriaceae bacterium]
MKTKTTAPKYPRNSTSTILRLERINSEISSLKDNLKSYTCEPKTPGLFEQREAIRSKLDGLRTSNKELIKNIQSRKRDLDHRLESITGRLKQFQELERNVLEYIGMAKMHC